MVLGCTTGQTNRHQEGQFGWSLRACVVLYCAWLDARGRRISMGQGDSMSSPAAPAFFPSLASGKPLRPLPGGDDVDFECSHQRAI
jgi:hypothetical protein